MREPQETWVRASLVAQRLKRLPGMWETWVRSLGREDPLEKEMATHSSTLAWRIPWREEPGRLQSMGSLRVRHDWTTSLSLFSFMHWRRKWQPTPVLMPGESHGGKSLVGYSPWGRKELDTTDFTFTFKLAGNFIRIIDSVFALFFVTPQYLLFEKKCI